MKIKRMLFIVGIFLIGMPYILNSSDCEQQCQGSCMFSNLDSNTLFNCLKKCVDTCNLIPDPKNSIQLKPNETLTSLSTSLGPISDAYLKLINQHLKNNNTVSIDTSTWPKSFNFYYYRFPQSPELKTLLTSIKFNTPNLDATNYIYWKGSQGSSGTIKFERQPSASAIPITNTKNTKKY